uniref:L1 transposable element RRM domain-containing protein n=1 Tax=Monodelphis domestica TaxID=13616 RepID=A0A5F8G2T4_MONDO
MFYKNEDKRRRKRRRRGRRDNLRIIALPENPEINSKLNIVIQDIIKENCPEILEQGGNTATERAHRTPSTLNPQKTTSRNVIAKFQSFQTKEKILQEARKRQFRHKGMPIRVTQDLASSTLNDRKAWNMIFRKARELGLQPRISYPAKLTIYFQGKVWAFNKIKHFQLLQRKDQSSVESSISKNKEHGIPEKVNMMEREKEKIVIFSFIQTLFYKDYIYINLYILIYMENVMCK